jgi:hypothetical protein
MKGYVYIMYPGADPGNGWTMSDPILAPRPTLGACVPNIRRAVSPGDWIFPISGRVRGVQQYVVGGMRVKEKIDAFAALERFPENRQRKSEGGQLVGNIIISKDGKQNPDDYHTNFEKRLANYLVGDKSVVVDTPEAIERARVQTAKFLGGMFDCPEAASPHQAIGRVRKLTGEQVEETLEWINKLKKGEARSVKARNRGKS